MATIFRLIGAIVAAMAATLFLLAAIEFFSAIVHPVPADFKGTMEEMCQHVARYPQWVLAVVVPLWAGTAFAGTWIAGRIGNRGCAVFIGLLLLAAVIFNVAKLPYPLWFKAVILVAVP